MRFLVSRRWILFAIAVVLLAYGCYLLGRWQFHRLAETKAENAIVSRNLAAGPVQFTRVMPLGGDVSPDNEWRRVVIIGTYDTTHQVIVRYQVRGGLDGVDVVTPLRTTNGAVLVDRGWEQTSNTTSTPKVAPPPTTSVTVVGWARVNGTGAAVEVAQGSTRAISSAAIGKTLPYPVYGGFVDGLAQTPPSAHPLVRADRPGLGDGPHYFYGLQWWFFGVLAVFGFFYFAYDERRRLLDPQSERSMPPSTGSITPVMNEAAGDSRNAAARPNSSGSP